MKKIVKILLLVMVMIVFVSCRNKNIKGLPNEGAFYDNITIFKGSESEIKTKDMADMDNVTKVYLQGITYQIKELDEENMTAILEVSIPNLTDILPQVITDTMKGNEDLPYDKLLETVKIEIEKILSDESTERITSEIIMSIENIEGTYKIVYNEKWEEFVFGALEDMYLESYRIMIGGLLNEIPE